VYITVWLCLLTITPSKAQDPVDTVAVSEPAIALDSTETVPAVKDSFFLRQVPDSVLTALKKQRSFAYANDPAYWIEKPYQPTAFDRFLYYLFTHGWVKWLLFILLGILLGYALFRILQSARLNIFYTRRSKKAEDSIRDASSLDWSAQLAQAESAGDFRSAIRFHYLQTLQVLASKEMLAYHPETTNQEYLDQLRGNPVYDAFSQLTRIYEYAWYGGFSLAEPLYRQAANLFQSFQESLT
jgi:hypothetical protein